MLWVSAFFIIVPASITIGCGTPGQATMYLTAPSTATKGTPFTITVHVVYQGKPDSVINGVIHFTSSDPAAVLPIDYQFTHADAGSHTWTNGFTLSTSGNQTITGQIHDASAINGTATIAVSP
ncbi:MAG TPA: hypothetical protein VGS27_07045 [Candidatus Sulfotelmatobacter sp.]|nr:hypothetical protein [Candidatus Sulfotelmatobacter sp.]